MRLPKLFTTIFSVLLTTLVLSLSVVLLPTPTHAQIQSDTTAQTSYNADTDRVQSTVIGLLDSAICLLSGQDIINPERGCLGIDPVNHKLSYDSSSNSQNTQALGGLLGMSTSMVSGLYVRPVTTASYISYLGNNFGVGPKTYAQTNAQGFDNLSSLQSIWTTIRNITYFVFTILFVFIGIAIMLRIKIDPRTVMSIQNQIPKAIIAILMITFSYAIVGLLVDMMWVTTYTGINVLASSDTTAGESVREAATKNLINNPISYVWFVFSAPKGTNERGPDNLIGLSKDVGISMGDVVSRTVTEVLGFDQSTGDCTGGHWYTLGIDVTSCVENGIRGFFKYLISAIVLLIVLVAIFLALFRVWFTLLKSLVYIIIYTIIAPFVILGGLIPGSTFGFGRWIRTILANLIVYPVTVFIFLLARIVAFNPQVNDVKQTFIPPLVANPGAFTNFGALIAFGLIMVAPEMLGFMQAALKAKPGPVGDIVKKGFSAGVPAGTAVPKAVWGNLNAFDPHKQQLGALAMLRMRGSQRLGAMTFGLLNNQSRKRWTAYEDMRKGANDRVTGGAGINNGQQSTNNTPGTHS